MKASTRRENKQRGDETMKRMLIVVTWAFFACGMCFAGTIKIDGKGIVRRAPDGVVITFEISALHTNMVESLRLLSAQESQIVKQISNPEDVFRIEFLDNGVNKGLRYGYDTISTYYNIICPLNVH